MKQDRFSDDIEKKSSDPKSGMLQRMMQHPRLDKYREKSWWRTETFLIGGAILAALFSAGLSHSSRTAYRELLERKFQTQRIVVAAAYLKGNLSQNFVSVENLTSVLGRSLLLDLKPGDPILLTAVTGADVANRMAEKVPAGKRLFNLSITDNSAGLGFVHPNDHVDILAHMELPNRGPVTFTVLQDVTLVSVGASSVINGEGLGGTAVSFFVDPEEFEVLSFAQAKGRFSLSLRNPNDTSKRAANRGVDLNAFLDSRRISSASGGGELEVIEAGKKIISKVKIPK
ncbi:MAG: Flp pilus assembly protein CpaB [Proteobacteria bacterium]|nr:Flp pilus assembly protein CpaB [Pseudomonadota bacterium]